MTDASNFSIDTIFNPNDHVINMSASVNSIQILFNPQFYYPGSQNMLNFSQDNNDTIGHQLNKKLSLEASPIAQENIGT